MLWIQSWWRSAGVTDSTVWFWILEPIHGHHIMHTCMFNQECMVCIVASFLSSIHLTKSELFHRCIGIHWLGKLLPTRSCLTMSWIWNSFPPRKHNCCYHSKNCVFLECAQVLTSCSIETALYFQMRFVAKSFLLSRRWIVYCHVSIRFRHLQLIHHFC